MGYSVGKVIFTFTKTEQMNRDINKDKKSKKYKCHNIDSFQCQDGGGRGRGAGRSLTQVKFFQILEGVEMYKNNSLL